MLNLCLPWKQLQYRTIVNRIVVQDFFSRREGQSCARRSLIASSIGDERTFLTPSMTACAYVFPLAFSNITCKRTNSAPCTKSHTRRLTPSARRWFVSVYNVEVSQLSLMKLWELARALPKDLSGHKSWCSCSVSLMFVSEYLLLQQEHRGGRLQRWDVHMYFHCKMFNNPQTGAVKLFCVVTHGSRVCNGCWMIHDTKRAIYTGHEEYLKYYRQCLPMFWPC